MSEGRRPLRVVFLNSWRRAPDTGSGTAVSISTLARSLASRGHEVRSAMQADRRGPLWLRRLWYNMGVRRRLERTHPDLVVGFDLDGFLLPGGDYPLVVLLKGVAADESRFERGAARLRLRAAALLEGRNARKADLVVVPSAYSGERAVEEYGLDDAKVRVVPEAVEPGPWQWLRSHPPGRRNDRPTILSVARQYRRKNSEVLLHAIDILRESVPGVLLRIVGGGPELRRLRRRSRKLGLEGRVELTGPIPDTAEVQREYFRADCFCLPTLQEGFGIVFLEAMSAGLPIVAGRVAAVPEVVPDGVAGLLVDPTSPEAVASALGELLADPTRRREMGRAGIQHARRFTPDRMSRAFLDVVNEVVEPGGH